MHKKRLFIAGLFSLAILLLVQTVSAGCCVSSLYGACMDEDAATECTDPDDFDASDCSGISSCDIVCCLDTTLGTSDAKYRVSCPSPSVRFVMFSPDRIAPYEPVISPLRREACQSCEPTSLNPTGNLVETCPDGSPVAEVMTAECRIRPPETLGVYVPTGNTCPEVTINDRDGDGTRDADDVCPDEPAITTQAIGTAPHFASEVGYCRDFINNDCHLDDLTDYADWDDCPAPCTADTIVVCADRSRVTTDTCDPATRELSPTGLECPRPEAVPEGSCGDGIVQTPNAAFFTEQCDRADDACGTGGVCRSEGDPRACTCEYACIADPGVPFGLDVRRDPPTDEIRVLWGLSSTCELAWFDIYRCDGAADCDPLSGHVVRRVPETLDPSGEATHFTYLDSVSPELEEAPMCYQVVAHYTNGVEVASDPACTGAAPAECSRFDAPFCNDDRTAVITCTGAGTSEEPCAPSEFCRESTSTGPSGATVSGAQCIAQSPCDQCNGFLGLFGFLDITIPAGACDLLPSCAYDYSKSIVDKYHMCSDIDSCYDYNSQAACDPPGDRRDQCSVGREEGCKWNPSPNAQALGAGVCHPINEADQNCERCNAENRESDNQYFTGCTSEPNYLNQQNCALYGFDRSLGTSGLPSCRFAPNPAASTTSSWLCQNARDLGCQSYGADATACGGTPIAIEVTWTGTPERKTAGTNVITARSNDSFRYGTCKFDTTRGPPRVPGTCFKDADGNGEPDCDQSDFACQKDNLPPATVVTAADVPVRDGRLLLGRNVDLDVSLSEQGTTFFCINPPDGTSGDPCYPQMETVCKLQRVMASDTPRGQGMLRYFSEDGAHNLEEVTDIRVFLDMDAPVMDLINSFDPSDRSLEITLSTTEEVTCNGILTDVHQGVIHAGRGSGSNNAIDAERGSSFSRTYYSVDDGVYLYQYTCWDEAGNRARNDERITTSNEAVIIVDTNPIDPQTPAGILTATGDQVITVLTDADARCKYGPNRESYERMPHPFLSTGGSTHTATVAGCTNCFREWYVSCLFDGVEEGNDQDVVRYSVDLAHPRVLAFNTLDADVEFHSSTVYGSTQNIFFKCVDDDIKVGFGVIGYDFGCASMDVTHGSVTVRAAGDDMAGPFLIRGDDTSPTPITETITATATDLGENANPAPLSIPVTIDRTDPELEVTVRNALTGEVVVPGPDMLGPLEYTIEARTIGVVGEILASHAAISHSVPAVGFAPQTIVLEELESLRSASSAVFRASFAEIPELDSDVPYDVAITLRARVRKQSAACAPDEESFGWHEWETIPAIEFQLDTHLPTVTLEPLLDMDHRGTSDYPSYPIYYYGFPEDLYYTNQTSIFLTGYVDDMALTPEVLFWSGSRSDEFGSTPSVRVVVSDYASSTLREGLTPIAEPATTGSESVHFGAGTVTGRYYWFSDEEDGHERRSYGKYMRMYGISSVASTPIGTRASLDGPLEADILTTAGGFTYQYGDNPWPPNWFGEWIPLHEGENWLSVVAKSRRGITSVPRYYHIIVDTNAPEVVESLPGPSDTSRAIDTISIVVRESKQGAPLLLDSLALDLNGTIIRHGDLTIISDDSDPEFTEYFISYTHDEPFNGTYHVRWIGHDKAANTLRSGAGLVEYDFTVGDGLPEPPTWEIVDAAEHDGIWYTADNRAPFVVDFSAEASAVELVDVFFGIYEAVGLAPTRRSCTSDARNVFRCAYEPPLRTDEAYHIVVEARKTLTEGPGLIGRYTSPPVVVDNTPPVIVDVRYQDPVAEDITLPIEIVTINERWALQGELHYAGDARDHPLEMTGNDRAGRYVFTWDIPNYASGLIPALERPNPITITIQDYAGNVGAPWIGDITLDMTPPSILGFTFEPDVPFALADHYYTNSRTLRINGEFTDADIDAVVITPGNYEGARDDFAPAAYASIRPDNTYEIILQLHGVENGTTTTSYRYAVMDAAGNRVERPFQVTVDMMPPEEPSITIS